VELAVAMRACRVGTALLRLRAPRHALILIPCTETDNERRVTDLLMSSDSRIPTPGSRVTCLCDERAGSWTRNVRARVTRLCERTVCMIPQCA
jgi:hypothetical protein